MGTNLYEKGNVNGADLGVAPTSDNPLVRQAGGFESHVKLGLC